MRALAMALSGVAALALAGCNVSIGNNASSNAGSDTAAATTHYVNSRASAVSPVLQQSYVDFAFDYPQRWNVTPQRTDGNERNFVRVAAPMVNGFEPYALHVGYVTGSGNAESDRRDMEQGTPGFAQQFGSSFNDFQLVSVGPARVGRYDTYGWRFTATAPSPNGGPTVRIYGRGDFVLPPGATRGLTLISLVTDRAPDSQSAAQVGETGPLKAVLDSLQLTEAGAAGK
ncbi:MAG TPA: hypothetical protein VIT38_00440 [Allosphingosinicella sp.]